MIYLFIYLTRTTPLIRYNIFFRTYISFYFTFIFESPSQTGIKYLSKLRTIVHPQQVCPSLPGSGVGGGQGREPIQGTRRHKLAVHRSTQCGTICYNFMHLTLTLIIIHLMLVSIDSSLKIYPTCTYIISFFIYIINTMSLTC